MRRNIQPLMDTSSTLIKRERTTDLKLAHFPRELAATLAALPSISLIPSAPFTDPTDWGAHAPSRAGFSALAETIFYLTTKHTKLTEIF